MTETSNGNGTIRWSMTLVCIIGAVSLFIAGAVLLTEEHASDAAVYIGLITATAAPTITGILAIAGQRKNAETMKRVVVQTNHRMNQLLDATAQHSYMVAYAVAYAAAQSDAEAADKIAREAVRKAAEKAAE